MKKIEVNISFGTILMLVMGAVIAFLVVSGGKLRLDRDRLSQALLHTSDSVRFYEVEIDGLQQRVFETEAMVLERSKTLRNHVAYGERLKALNIRRASAIADLTLKVSFLQDSLILYRNADTVKVVSVETWDDGEIIGERPMVELPVRFGSNDRWAESWGEIHESGFAETGFEIKELPLTLTIGSRGVFRKQYVSALSTPNPYVTLTKQDVILITPNSHKLQAGVLGFGLGVGITLAAMLLVN